MGLRLRGFVEAGSMTPEVVAKYPQEVRKLTREFKEAGAEVLQTLTFFGTSNMLAPAGLGDRAEEINRTACRIAREAGGGEALVAGASSFGELCADLLARPPHALPDGWAAVESQSRPGVIVYARLKILQTYISQCSSNVNTKKFCFIFHRSFNIFGNFS